MFAGSKREFLPVCNRFFVINWHLPDKFQVSTTLFGSDKQIFFAEKLIANKAKIAVRAKEEPLIIYFLKVFHSTLPVLVLQQTFFLSGQTVVFGQYVYLQCVMCSVYRPFCFILLTILCRIAVLVMMFWRFH